MRCQALRGIGDTGRELRGAEGREIASDAAWWRGPYATGPPRSGRAAKRRTSQARLAAQRPPPWRWPAGDAKPAAKLPSYFNATPGHVGPRPAQAATWWGRKAMSS